MSLWRVETENRKGPYKHKWPTQRELVDNHSCSPKHPPAHGGACTLPSAARLYEWFDGYWSDLLQHGFRIVQVMTDGEYPDVCWPLENRDFRGQMVFTGDHARMEVPFPEFLEIVFSTQVDEPERREEPVRDAKPAFYEVADWGSTQEYTK